MIGAYGWAFVKPIRKLYYNLTITFVSVVVALIVGGVEAIGLLKDQLNLTGGLWDFIRCLNDNFSTLGFVIMGVFIVSWMGAILSIESKGSTVWHHRERPLINASSRNCRTLRASHPAVSR
jgi:nickel/cobalt transporter (NiCoT) family protein